MIDREISTSTQRLRSLMHAQQPAMRTPEELRASAEAIKPDGLFLDVANRAAETILSSDSGVTDALRGLPLITTSDPKETPVTAFSHVADRMKAMRETVEKRRTQNAAKITDIETRAHAALDKQDTILKAEDADLRSFEDELNKMTNGGGE